jgi:cytoskeletal protein CcmA (bactofilin family)
MTNYTKTTDFASKDTLPSGNANKIVKGTEIDTEFNNIATAVATKADSASPTFTGVISVPDGSASAPSITNTGDTNAGLFFSAADTLAFTAGGTAQFTMADGVIAPVTDNDIDLGTSSIKFKDFYIDGIAYLDAINLNGTAITSTAAEINILDGVTSTAAELNILDGVTSTTAELNILDGVTSTAAEINLLDGVTATTTELNYNDTGASVGTVVASKVVTVDANKDVASFRNITLTGELDAGSLDISGDADIDGTLETDALSINGTAVTSTAAELNILDGATVVVGEINALDLGSTAVGTAIASKAVILDSSKDYTGIRNLTITGELDAGSLDISGDIDVDGTTNLDVVDIDGAVDFASTTAHAGNATFADNAKAIFGAGSDLQIYHDATDSYISDQGSGNLKLLTDEFRLRNAADGAHMLTGSQGGAITAYHNGSAKLATTSTGIDVTGDIDVSGVAQIGGSTDLLYLSGKTGTHAYVSLGANNTAADFFIGADTAIPLIFRTSATERMRIDAGGSVLIGKTTPTDLHNTWNHLIIGEKGAIISENGAGGIDGIFLADNVYIDADTGSYAYQTTAAASQIAQSSGVITFSNAASGSAGAALTPVERMRIDSSGDLLVNTTEAWAGETTPHIETRGDVAGDYTGVIISNTNDAAGDSASLNFGLARDGGLVFGNAGKITVGKEQDWTTSPSSVDAFMSFSTYENENSTERMRIDSSGNVGIGCTPSRNLDIQGTGDTLVSIVSPASNQSALFFGDTDSDSIGRVAYDNSDNSMRFTTNAAERMRIASGGGVEVTTSGTNLKAPLIQPTNGDVSSYTGTTPSMHSPASATLAFSMGGGERMRIDSTSIKPKIPIEIGSSSYFLGNATNGYRFNNAANTSNLMILQDSGTLLVGKTSPGDYVTGFEVQPAGAVLAYRTSGVASIFGRTNDGEITRFTANSQIVGNISVSSGTVSYNPFMGSHYSETNDTNLLFGTVMEATGNLVEDQYASQARLSKTKISDVSESSAVYGVWIAPMENGGETIAALGASWCRINSSETVALGDLLVSNGDGTAKVQSDDIIRSKTIGKVTSTTIKETHADGSYVVPVVLYCG